MRIPGMFVGLAFLALSAAHGGSPLPAGNWKVTIYERGQKFDFWLLKLESKDGKLTGSVQSLQDVPSSRLKDVSIRDGRLYLDIFIPQANQTFAFEGVLLPDQPRKVRGSLAVQNQIIPAILEATQASNPRELNKELVAQSPDDPKVFDAVRALIRGAAAEKAKVNDVREWVQTSLRQSAKFGPRWQRKTAVEIIDLLAKQKDYAEVTLATARAAEKLPGATAETRLRILDATVSALKALGRNEQAAAEGKRLDQLEAVAFREYSKTSLPFEPDVSPRGKAMAKRPVLVELFTGAQCPPCLGADLAFDGLERTYTPADVVLLQFHLHIPAPDALTNADTEARQEYYKKHIEGTPTILFNGQSPVVGGAGRDGARDRYKQYRDIIDPLFKKAAGGSLKLQVTRQAEKVKIKARASDLDKTGPRVRLRLAIVEEWVRYQGRNGLKYHSRVVRAMPGGPNGAALMKKDSDHSTVVDLNALRDHLNKYLDDFARTLAPFPDGQRPLRLQNLHVVAFVQDDDTQEVLQVVQAPVPE
jgi:hypothetical protein